MTADAMTKQGKTGGWNTPWVELERPKPPPVADIERWWTDKPPEYSERCKYWLRQIERGWRPNRRILSQGYYGAAEWFGVYIFEYINVIYVALDQLRDYAVSDSEGSWPT